MIFINGRFLTQKVTGVNRYAIGICDAFLQLKVDFTVIVPNWFTGNINYPYIKFGNLKSHLWEQINLFQFVKKNNNPVLLNFTGLGPVLYKNQLSTIHDLSLVHNPAWFNRKYYVFYSILTPILAKNAKKIITVSEFSKSEITRLLKVNPDKIFVAGLAPAKLSIDTTSQSSEPLLDLPKNYILAVSSIEPRKNFNRLLSAFKKLNNKECQLLVVGAGANHFKKVNFNDVQNVTFLGYVDDKTLEQLYRKAKMFIYPSLYEGFGIPPTEAMFYGCPVIVSDIPPLRETCMDAALYINPLDIDNMAQTMDFLLSDELLRKQLAEKGRENISRLSFVDSAKKILANL